MFKKNLKLYVITLCVLISGVVSAGLISRFTTFTDGNILTAAELNGEFNQLVNLVNGNLDNDNLSATAAISPAKITATIAGDGLSRNGSTGALAVSVDGSTIETSADSIQVKDDGITHAKLQEEVGLSVLGTAIAASGNLTTITAGTDGYVLERSGSTLGFGQVVAAGIATDAVITAKIQDGAVTPVKRSTAVTSVSSSSGSFSTSSTTYVAVTNMTVTFTVTGSRPVLIMGQTASTSEASPTTADGSMVCFGTSLGGSIQPRCALSLRKDGTTIGVYDFFGHRDTSSTLNGNGDSFCSGLSFYDASPTAGSHTYALVTKILSSSTSLNIVNCKLVAYEL